MTLFQIWPAHVFTNSRTMSNVLYHRVGECWKNFALNEIGGKETKNWITLSVERLARPAAKSQFVFLGKVPRTVQCVCPLPLPPSHFCLRPNPQRFFLPPFHSPLIYDAPSFSPPRLACVPNQSLGRAEEKSLCVMFAQAGQNSPYS